MPKIIDTLWARVGTPTSLTTCCFLRRDKADTVHHIYLSEFKKAYPEAKLLGVEGTSTRMGDKALKFDGGENLTPDSRDFLILAIA